MKNQLQLLFTLERGEFFCFVSCPQIKNIPPLSHKQDLRVSQNQNKALSYLISIFVKTITNEKN